MWIENTGGITANKPFDAAALNVLNSNCNLFDDEWLPEFGDMHLVFEEVRDGSFEEVLEEIVQKLKPLGYVFNGTVHYYGDYEGNIYVDDNVVECVDIENIGLHDASSGTLAAALERRGYIVLSCGDLESIVAGADIAGYLESTQEIVVDTDEELADILLNTYRKWLPLETDDSFLTYVEKALRKAFGQKEEQQ